MTVSDLAIDGYNQAYPRKVHASETSSEALALRKLALAVIRQALTDAELIPSGNPTAEEKQEATEFLDNSLMLHLWCEVAGIELAS